jgi:hypothetical protein
MIQGARPFKAKPLTAYITSLLPDPNHPARFNHSIICAAKIKAPFEPEFRTYLLEADLNSTRLIASALRLTEDPAGDYLLKTILRLFETEPHMDDQNN